MRHQATAPPTQRIPYANQNGSAVLNANNTRDYRPVSFIKIGPSGETLQEWRDAQHLLDGRNAGGNGLTGGNAGHNGNALHSGGGFVNRAFVGDDLSPQSPVREGPVSNSQRGDNTHNSPESPSYKPSKSSYGLSTHNSFKRPDPNTQQNSPLKKQPRTQLAVPPCRPELPPRNEQAHRPDNLDLALPAAVPKDKSRKHRSPPRKSSMSPRELKYTPSLDSSPRNNSNDTESPRSKGTIPYMAFSAGSVQSEENATSPSSRINVHGSMEKISRV